MQNKDILNSDIFNDDVLNSLYIENENILNNNEEDVLAEMNNSILLNQVEKET
jgi:hypothetical protein